MYSPIRYNIMTTDGWGEIALIYIFLMAPVSEFDKGQIVMARLLG